MTSGYGPDKKINPELQFRFVNHILDRAKKSVRINWGALLVLAVVVAAIIGTFWAVQQIGARIGN